MLYGRDRETRTVDALLDDARDGRSGVLIVAGESGIGKSALLGYAHDLAVKHGMRILKARGIRSEARIPFAGLLELLRPALACLPAIPAPQAEALQSALALRPAKAGSERFATGAATLSLLAACAESAPLAVLVDDGHWLDGSSADALLFAVRRLFADPVAVIAAVRAGESSPLGDAGLPTLTLGGLDLPATAELLASQFGGPVREELAGRLHRETGGNPLALIELAGLPEPADDHTPVGVRTSAAEAYLTRYFSLPGQTRDILVLAAAADRGDMSVLARAAGVLNLDMAALVPAEAAGLVGVRDAVIEFRHPLARSAIYGQAAPETRRDVHRALARSLPDADMDRRAWHLALAAFGPDPVAATALEQAGQRARERSAYEVASRAYTRAARLAPDPPAKARLLYQAADAAWIGGLAGRALELLDEAGPYATDPEHTTPLRHLRGHIATSLGPVADAWQILVTAADQAEPGQAIVMLAEAVQAAFYAGDADAMLEAADRAAALQPAGGDDRATFFSLIAQGAARIFRGQGEHGATQVRQAVEVLERSGELRDDPRLLTFAVMGALWLREGRLGAELVDRALTAARQRSAIGVLPSVLVSVSFSYAGADRWAEALACLHEAIGLARETGQHTELAFALARLALLEARLGHAERSRQHAEEGLDLSRRLGLGLAEVWALGALADRELALGQPEAALALFQEQQAVLTARRIRDVDLSPGPELADLYLRLDHNDEAAVVMTSYSRAAEAKGQPWALARAARCRALVAADEAEFEAALELHAQTPDVFETARTMLAYGAQLRRARKRVQAREQLRAAVDAFDALGAEPWSAMARGELAATGETARRRDQAMLTELTPQELQIALRVAEGKTTRETAAVLFLSPKTVEYHLHNIYRKLAIRSRAELAAALEVRSRKC